MISLQGTAFGKEVDPSNPFNMTGKEFDMAKSGVLFSLRIVIIIIGDDHFQSKFR